MRLFIAEKPSVAKALATALGVTGKGDGYIEAGNDVVTWCIGHLLELAEPDEYTPDDVPLAKNGKKVWRTDELPIIPQQWNLHPKPDTKKQLNCIGKLLKKATVAINCGDIDRAGQALVDEVLDHFNWNGPTKRYWVSSIDDVSVKKGLQDLKENKDFVGMADAAKARARADWLIGMNLSRAFTLKAARGGSRAVISVGRVQTPTLAIVAQRDNEIANFKSIPFYKLSGQFKHGENQFNASWIAKEDQAGLDDEGRLIDKAIADQLANDLTGQSGFLSDYSQTKKKKKQPLTYSLADISAEANKKFGHSAQDVLNACQSLYETHKLTSYPRTDCAYLPESMLSDASDVLKAIKIVNPAWSSIVDAANPSIKSPTWNDKKVTAHHGIIPTQQSGSISKLSQIEKNVYELVVKAYIAQFYPEHEFMATQVDIEVGGEHFRAKGNVIVAQGWCAVMKAQEEAGDSNEAETSGQVLPPMAKNDAVTCVSGKRSDAKTNPPKPFTEGTLLKAMENIHRFVTDSEHKKLLRDGDGIGTPATRAGIINELKNRKFLVEKGRNIVSSELGRSVVNVLPQQVTSPVLTAIFERLLSGIEKGTNSLDDFVAKQVALVKAQVEKANQGSLTLAGDTSIVKVSDHKCKSCGKGLIKRKGKKGMFWSCSGYPECNQSYPDMKGRPNFNPVVKPTRNKVAS